MRLNEQERPKWERAEFPAAREARKAVLGHTRDVNDDTVKQHWLSSNQRTPAVAVRSGGWGHNKLENC